MYSLRKLSTGFRLTDPEPADIVEKVVVPDPQYVYVRDQSLLKPFISVEPFIRSVNSLDPNNGELSFNPDFENPWHKWTSMYIKKEKEKQEIFPFKTNVGEILRRRLFSSTTQKRLKGWQRWEEGQFENNLLSLVYL